MSERIHRVVAADVHSVDYQKYRTRRLIRMAELAAQAAHKFNKDLREQPGSVTLEYGSSRVAVMLTRPYVRCLQQLAHREYLALHDIGPDGQVKAEQAVANPWYAPETTKLEDHIDHVPPTGMH